MCSFPPSSISEEFPPLTCDREIHISLDFSIEVFRAFYYDQMSREVNSPGKSGGGYQNLQHTKTQSQQTIYRVYKDYSN